MKCAFQFVRGADGVRSKPIVGNRNEVAKDLAAREDMVPFRDDFILIVGEYGEDDSFKLSNAPLMTIGSFIQLFGEPVHG